MLVGTHQKIAISENLVIDVDNARFERVNIFKYLGVHLIDHAFSWKDHIE